MCVCCEGDGNAGVGSGGGVSACMSAARGLGSSSCRVTTLFPSIV